MRLCVHRPCAEGATATTAVPSRCAGARGGHYPPPDGTILAERSSLARRQIAGGVLGIHRADELGRVGERRSWKSTMHQPVRNPETTPTVSVIPDNGANGVGQRTDPGSASCPVAWPGLAAKGASGVRYSGAWHTASTLFPSDHARTRRNSRGGTPATSGVRAAPRRRCRWLPRRMPARRPVCDLLRVAMHQHAEPSRSASPRWSASKLTCPLA